MPPGGISSGKNGLTECKPCTGSRDEQQTDFRRIGAIKYAFEVEPTDTALENGIRPVGTVFEEGSEAVKRQAAIGLAQCCEIFRTRSGQVVSVLQVQVLLESFTLPLEE